MLGLCVRLFFPDPGNNISVSSNSNETLPLIPALSILEEKNHAVTPNVAKSIAVVGFDFLALHVIGCWVCRGPLCRQRTPRYRVSLLLPKVQPGHLWTEGGCSCLNLLYSH